MRQVRDQIATGGGADFDQEEVPVVVDQLGQGEVEPGPGLGSGSHRRAKAGAAGLAAIDREDECLLAPDPVGSIPILAAKEHPVLDRDRPEFAGADPDEGEPLRGRVVFDGREPVAVTARLPEPLDRRVQEAFPGMRPDGIAEIGHVAAPFEAIAAAVLTVRPAGRKLVEAGQRVVHDCTVAHDRADHAIAAARQRDDDPVEDFGSDGEPGAGVQHVLRLAQARQRYIDPDQRRFVAGRIADRRPGKSRPLPHAPDSSRD